MVLLALAFPALATEYDLEDLGTLGGATSAAYTVTDSQAVHGRAATGSTTSVAMSWSRAGGIAAYTIPASRTSTVYGASADGAHQCGSNAVAVVQGGQTIYPLRAFVDGAMVTNPAMGASQTSECQDVNASGLAVGRAASRPYRWSAGTPTVINLPGGTAPVSGHALAVSDAGKVVGWMQATATSPRFAFLWNGTATTQLSLTALGSVSSATATDINEAGAIVGYATVGTVTSAFLRTSGGALSTLEMLDGATDCRASALNESDVVVGGCVVSGVSRAVLWDTDGVRELGALGGDESYATMINEAGDVVGYAETPDGFLHAFLATECSDLDGDDTCDRDDLCPTVADDGADVDGDGVGDACDNCLDVANADQADGDDDLLGDVCDNCPDADNFDQADQDGDLTGDVCDNCASDFNPEQDDVDTDEVGDICDNCPDDENADQADADFDAVGDTCDNCPVDANADQADADGDDLGDSCDTCPDDAANDEDGDYVCGDVDFCADTVIPETPSGGLGTNRWADTNGDGVFDTSAPRGRGPERSYTIDETAGCSCLQIGEELGVGEGHDKYGCSIGVMDEWVELMSVP